MPIDIFQHFLPNRPRYFPKLTDLRLRFLRQFDALCAPIPLNGGANDHSLFFKAVQKTHHRRMLYFQSIGQLTLVPVALLCKQQQNAGTRQRQFALPHTGIEKIAHFPGRRGQTHGKRGIEFVFWEFALCEFALWEFII
ncbi:Uncharacterised protein [Brucella neotomae]|nr:Uncharacterised protein [Brucella neotomae]